MPKQNTLQVSLQVDVQIVTTLDQQTVTDCLIHDHNQPLYVGLEAAFARGTRDLIDDDSDDEIETTVIDISLAAGSHGEGTRRLPTVVEYFEDKLGEGWPYPCDASHPASPAHPDFHIESGCGRDCANAIDAAVEAIRHVKKAFGDDQPELVKGIVEACSATVRCYVYG